MKEDKKIKIPHLQVETKYSNSFLLLGLKGSISLDVLPELVEDNIKENK